MHTRNPPWKLCLGHLWHWIVFRACGPVLTKARIKVEEDRGKSRVAEALELNPRAARPGENEPILHRPKI